VETAGGPLPIVAIGASAGGLEALERFLRHVPERCGLAFIVVQHLDPTHTGMLPELLQRATPMPVRQVTDAMAVEPDTVYVIPPNADMALHDGALHLYQPSAPRGLRLPIDFLFSSVADHARERGVGVILSGMGSDGTLGAAAIRANAGVVMVQDPATAQFDAMPRSAIDAGVADVIAPVAELPLRIVAYLAHAPLLRPPTDDDGDASAGVVERIVLMLLEHTGHDFSLYKRATVLRRIERRMGVHQLPGMDAYVRFLRSNPEELTLLFKELLIGVTGFFRDAEAWTELGERVLPPLLARLDPAQPIRAWVAGCATGEEAYSLAIVLREAVDRLHESRAHPIKVFATDLDADAIDKARQGRYLQSIVTDVSAERLAKFFDPVPSGFQVAKEIRDLVIFAHHNVTRDPPFTKLDVVSCRNLLIYFAGATQQKVLQVFQYGLRPGGVLLLGSSEAVGLESRRFAPISVKHRIFERINEAATTGAHPIGELAPTRALRPAARPAAVAATLPNLKLDAEHVLLHSYSPAAVLTTSTGDIVFVNGRINAYLEPASGKSAWNIFTMAVSAELRQELSTAFVRATESPELVVRKRVSFGAKPSTKFIDLTVQFMQGPSSLRGMLLVVFADAVAVPARRTKRHALVDYPASVAALEKEVEQLRVDMLENREVAQSAQEDLNAANEELQSANEELQSTNEELTTSKEEMQSMNEELRTLNRELERRIEEVSHMSNDMKNLLDSTDVATVFLDRELRIRLFTAGSTRMFSLIPGDVGRPITDLAPRVVYPELAAHAQDVLRTAKVHTQEAATTGDRWVMVRIMPYRTTDNRVDGVTITFSDITDLKHIEQQLRGRQEELERVVARHELTIARGRQQGASGVVAALPDPRE